jgi:hypothetical protein
MFRRRTFRSRKRSYDQTGVSPIEPEKSRMEKIRIEQHSFVGTLWVAAWLFTVGFLHVGFWKGLLAILLWPYYLGTTFSHLLPP